MSKATLSRVITIATIGAAAALAGASIATAAPTSFSGNGHYRVGYDIAPGTYVGTGQADDIMGCWWERQSGLSGEYEDVIALDYTHAKNVYVTIQPTDVAFFSEDCGTWTLVQPAPAPAPTGSFG